MTAQPEEKILDRVRKLLDRASHPGTPEPERDACMKKADSLMLKYAIDEALLEANKKGDRRTPTSVRIHAYDRYNPWKHKFQTMMYGISQTTRTKCALHPDGDVTIVGMLEDVDYFQLLWTSVYLGFVSKLEPKWEPDLSFNHNVYNLKNAGYKWKGIAEKANAAQEYVEWPDGGRLIRAYKAHCKMIGETPTNHTQRHEAYRESFAEGFVSTISVRLEEMREAQREATTGSGAEVALRSVDDRVEEVYYDLFPNLRPATEEEVEAQLKAARERQEREAREREEMLAAMTERQRQDFFAKEERERQKRMRDNERYWREQDKKYDSQGSRAGRKAAQSVDFFDSKKVDTSNTRGEIQ